MPRSFDRACRYPQGPGNAPASALPRGALVVSTRYPRPCPFAFYLSLNADWFKCRESSTGAFRRAAVRIGHRAWPRTSDFHLLNLGLWWTGQQKLARSFARVLATRLEGRQRAVRIDRYRNPRRGRTNTEFAQNVHA